MKTFLQNSKILSTVFLLMTLFFASESFGQTNTWDGSSNVNWNTAANWSLNQVPTSAHDVVIPDNFTVTVNTAAVCKSFTMGAGGNDITVTISSSNSLTVTNVVTISNGSQSGDNRILAVGAGTLTCSSISIANSGNDNRYSDITLSTGTVNVTGDITMGGNATRNNIAFSSTGVLNIGGTITGGGLTPSTGTVNYNAAGAQAIGVYTYNNLTTSGSGTKTLATGTVVNGTVLVQGTSTLVQGATNLIANTAPVRLNGGTYRTGATTGYSDTVGVLTLAEDSNLILGTTNHTLTFANSNAASWTSGKMLTITGWQGGYNGTTAGSNPKIFFSNSSSALTAAQLEQVRFFNGTNYFFAMLLGSGELVPTPVRVSSFSPTVACAGGTITITGEGFTSVTVTGVQVNGANVSSFNVNSDTSITATLTNSNTSGAVSVVTSAGTYTSGSGALTVNPALSAINITPSSATVCANSIQALVASGGETTAVSILGTGTSVTAATSQTSTLGPNPLQSYYGGTKQQMLVTAAELSALGITSAGTINSIAFNLSVAENRTLQNYVVRMQNTTLSSFTSTAFVTTGFTTVRNAANLTPVSGWNTISLDAPFLWDGTNNLLIEITFSNNDNGGTGTSRALYSTTSFPSSLFYRVDGQTAATVAAATTASYAAYSSRNNMRFGYTVQAPITWSPTTDLYSNALANIAYTGTPLTTVYTKPTVTRIYTATATLGGCANSSSSVEIAVKNTWLGTTSNVWNVGSNWSCGVPTASSDVVISTAANYPEISSEVTINSLTLDSGTTLKVNPAYDLTVTGIIHNNGTLTIENTANLVQVNDVDNTGSGTTVVKRNSSAVKRLDYTLWSSPVTGQGLYAFSPLTLSTRFYQYLTATNLYNNSGLGFSISGADPVTGIGGTDTANIQFATAKGYLIRAPWNHPTAPAVWTGTFTGVPNNGDIPVTVSTAGEPIIGYGYNAVGNPYPSRLSVPAFIDGNSNITGTLYFWRKTNDNATTSYATLTKIAYTANGAPGGDTGTGFFPTEGNAELDWVINVGQGFFVKVNSGSTVNFTNGMRRSSNSNQFFRNSQTTNTVNEGLYWLNLNTDSGIFSQMAVGYTSEGTLDFDRGIDGENINKEFYLTSLINNENYAIQGRPSFESTDVVPLSYKVATAGNHSISIDHTSGLFSAGQVIYLRDNLTSTIHNLNSGAYNFSTEAGTFTTRFEVMYQLPLGIDNPTFNENQVVIYQNEANSFGINTGDIVMSSVKVFDVRGRLLLENKGINASQTTITAGQANEVLLVQITSQDGMVVTKKVLR